MLLINLLYCVGTFKGGISNDFQTIHLGEISKIYNWKSSIAI